MKILKFGTKIIEYSSKGIGIDWVPIPLPPHTLRIKVEQGYDPRTSSKYTQDTLTLVDAEQNIWDITVHYYYSSDMPNVRSWHRLFADDIRLIAVLGANSSDVYDIRQMFEGCTKLESTVLFDISNITNTYNLFAQCKSLVNVPLFDTSNVTNMNSMFLECDSLTTVPLFDTSNVTDISQMFQGCDSLANVPLFDTSNVTNMAAMFLGCTSLTTVPLFDTSNVTNMYQTFRECSSLASIPLFNTSKVTDVYQTFAACINVESGALAMYNQLSTQTTPPSSHTQTFRNCGINTVTGAAELAQIPAGWK